MTILIYTFVSRLKLEAILPYELLEDHTYTLVILTEVLLVLSQDSKYHLDKTV